MKKTLTVKEIVNAYNILASLKLQKFDKSVRSAAIKNFAALKGVVKEYEEFQECVREKLFEDRKDEMSIVSELRAKLTTSKNREEMMSINHQIVSGHPEYLKLEEEYSNQLKEKGKKTVDVEISAVEEDRWIDSLIAAEIDFSPADINALEFMFENN